MYIRVQVKEINKSETTKKYLYELDFGIYTYADGHSNVYVIITGADNDPTNKMAILFYGSSISVVNDLKSQTWYDRWAPVESLDVMLKTPA